MSTVDPFDPAAFADTKLVGDERLVDGLTETVLLVPATDLDAMRSALTQEIAREDSVPARLKALPTWARDLAGVGVAGVIATLAILAMPRADLAVVSPTLLAAGAGLHAGAVALAVRVALRPLHKPPLGWKRLAALLFAVVVPLVFALVPQAHGQHPASLAGGLGSSEFAARAAGCFGFGAVMALPLVGALVLLHRGGIRRAPMIGVSAGVSGALAVMLHCPITHAAHLVAGHATVAVGVAIAALAISVVAERRR